MLGLFVLFSTSTTSATGLKVMPVGAGGARGVAGARPFLAVESWETGDVLLVLFGYTCAFEVTVMGRSRGRVSSFFSSSVDISLMNPLLT